MNFRYLGTAFAKVDCMNTATVLITGNTYPVRAALSALGGTWDATAKGWNVPADKAAEASALVGPAPVRRARAAGPTIGDILLGRAPNPGYRLRTGNRL